MHLRISEKQFRISKIDFWISINMGLNSNVVFTFFPFYGYPKFFKLNIRYPLIIKDIQKELWISMNRF